MQGRSHTLFEFRVRTHAVFLPVRHHEQARIRIRCRWPHSPPGGILSSLGRHSSAGFGLSMRRALRSAEPFDRPPCSQLPWGSCQALPSDVTVWRPRGFKRYGGDREDLHDWRRLCRPRVRRLLCRFRLERRLYRQRRGPRSQTASRPDPDLRAGLDELVERNVAAGASISRRRSPNRVRGADVVFLAVGTPIRRGDGYADLTYIYEAVEDMAPHLGRRHRGHDQIHRARRHQPRDRAQAESSSGQMPNSPSAPTPNSCAKGLPSKTSPIPTACWSGATVRSGAM